MTPCLRPRRTFPQIGRALSLLLLLWLPLSAQASAPVVFFSDLDSGPNTGGQDDKGVFVTVWGKNFGAARGAGFVSVGGGQADNYPLWSDTKIVFQLGGEARSGEIVVKTSTGESSNGVAFTVRSGRIFFVSAKGSGGGSLSRPLSPADAYARMRPGDTFYFRAGEYGEKYGDLNWSNSNYALGPRKSGTAGHPVAFVGYPNEAAVFRAPGGRGSNINLRDSSNKPAGQVTIANLVLVGGDTCIGSGGVTVAYGESAKSGAPGMRVVGNVMSATYTGNTMSALIQFSNDGARLYGNEFKDAGTTPPIRNNHAVYINLGASDVDVGWNYFHDLRMGHIIQVHTDTYFPYTDVRIHDNVLSAADPADSRGINVGNVSPGSHGTIYNNVLYNLGQGFSAIAIYGGDWKVYNNTLYNISSGQGLIWLNGQWGGRPTAEIYNNILHSDGTSPFIAVLGGLPTSQANVSNNLYFNHEPSKPRIAELDKKAHYADPMFLDPANGDFRLRSGSPGIDRGNPAVGAVVLHDRDGVRRPQGKGFDIGAYETNDKRAARVKDQPVTPATVAPAPR